MEDTMRTAFKTIQRQSDLAKGRQPFVDQANSAIESTRTSPLLVMNQPEISPHRRWKPARPLRSIHRPAESKGFSLSSLTRTVVLLILLMVCLCCLCPRIVVAGGRPTLLPSF
jgi:hypothetical protein